MKKIVFFVVLFAFFNVINSTDAHHEKLHKALSDSKILHLLDGNLIDKDVIKNTRWAVQEIMKMQLGEFDKISKKRSDVLNLHGKNYLSIQTLVKIENTGRIEEESLIAFKERFDEVVKPLMQKAKGAEKFMIKFIQESCKARDRDRDSLLMDWKGDEHDKSFKQKIKTFKDLNIFFTDMLNFFYDLNVACPKAVKAYEDSLKK